MPGHHHHHHHHHRASTGASAYYAPSSSRGSSMASTPSYELTYGLGGYTSRGGALKWRCCQCSEGWFSTAIDAYCPSCQNARCSNCSYATS